MFDLEKAIKLWRQTLNKNSALEDGYKEELECHLRDKIEYLIEGGSSEKNAFEKAVQKIGEAHSLGTEFYKAYTRKKSGRPPWEQSRWLPSLISNYFKIGLRKIRRQRIFAFINITGLAVGLACCTIIILYVTNELSYDKHHKDANRIFRVASHRINIVGEFRMATTPGPLGPELKASYPDVEEAVRIVPPYENASHVLVVREEKRFFENRVWFADKEIFQFFNIPMLKGSPQEALVNPNTVVITEGMAKKYFGEEDALGKTLQIEIDYDTGSVESNPYEVTGIVKNSPANTHLKYDMFLSMPTLSSNLPSFETDWLNPKAKFTYVKLVPGADAADFEKKIQKTAEMASHIYTEEFNRTLKLNEYYLQPVSRIHMFSHISREIDPPGDRTNSGYYMSTKGPDFANSARLKVITMDYDFIPEYEIKMVAGRPFQPGGEDDESRAYLINMAGVKELGFSSPEEALGKNYMAHYHRQIKRIVGVTEDFHYRGMQEVVEPLVLDIENSLMSTITLSFRVENMKTLLSFVEKTWEEHFPGVPFEYSFLDDNFAREYLYEEQMGRLLGMITSLGFIIACLGLFGLASFMAQSRKKEIGIRKVIGASTSNIVSMLSKDFVKLILASVLIASPLAWIAIQLWLQGFAYRIDMNLLIFFAVALGALVIAMTTVSIQGVRAAVANPVNTLHDE